MRTLTSFLVLAAVLTALSVSAFGQVQPQMTTLSAAVSDERATRLTVTSATGFTASTGSRDYGMFVDREFMRITNVVGTVITVQRSQSRTSAVAHKSGARVFVGVYGGQPAPDTTTPGPFIQTAMSGTCTRANYPILPLIQVNASTLGGQGMYNCLGGQWYLQTLPDDQLWDPLVICNIAIGSVAYASVGTNTADVADKSMRTTIYVPRTFVATGIQVLQGGTATTDNITAGLFDAGGKRIATTAAAGTLLATANTFKSIAFALDRNAAAQTLTLVTGPALYWIAVTGNGATAGAYQTVPTLTFKSVLTDSATSQTFGTWPDFTPATTFTQNVGPVVCLYQ